MAYFTEVSLEPQESPTTLHFTRAVPSPPLDEHSSQLYSDIRDAEVKIQRGFQSLDIQRLGLLKLLKQVADVGLVGDDADAFSGQREFKFFKMNAVIEAESIRKLYLNRTLRINIIAALIAFILGSAFLVFKVYSNVIFCDPYTNEGNSPPPECNEYQFNFMGPAPSDMGTPVAVASVFASGAFVLFGVAVGNIFRAYVMGRELSYDNFDRLNQYRYTPFQQLTMSLAISSVLLLLLAFNVVQVGVGGTLLNDFPDNPYLGVVIGLVATISELVVLRLIQNTSTPIAREEPPASKVKVE